MSPEVARHLLEGYMRDLSESHLQNGWTQDTEFILYRATWGGPEHWGNYMIGQMDCDVMQELSEAAMGWFAWDRSKGVHFVPVAEWTKKYSEWESQQQQAHQKKTKLIFDLAELALKRVREGGTI